MTPGTPKTNVRNPAKDASSFRVGPQWAAKYHTKTEYPIDSVANRIESIDSRVFIIRLKNVIRDPLT